MVRIPTLSRRSDRAEPVEAGQSPATTTATTTTTEADRTAADRGHARRGDTAETPKVGRDRGPATRTAITDPATGTAVTDPATGTAVTDPATPGPRPEPPTREETTGRPTPPPAPAGPRPRASMLATLSLITGLVGALFVLSGPLAPYGIALGVAALAFGLGGISATARRHIAGRTEALIGIVLALGTMLVGSLALTGSLTWLTTETDMAQQVRQWLDSQFAGLF